MSQFENGFTKIPNVLIDALYNHRIAGEQMQCLLFILRKTYGYNKKEDRISLSQFVEATGIVKPHISRALKELGEKNIIITNKGNYKITSYSINKSYAQWKSLPKKVTLPKKVMGITNNGNKVLPLLGTTKDNKKTITKKKKESINYHKIFEYYMSKDNLFRHRFMTRSMKDALSKAQDDIGLITKDFMDIIDCHSIVVERTKKNQFPVHRREFGVLFGQKVNGNKGSPLICEQFFEGGKYYEKYYINNQLLKEKTKENNPFRSHYEKS